MTSLEDLNNDIIACTRCPRLVEFREEVARKKRRMYMDWEYWGKPVPGFGDPSARILLVGLAPAAHGANRTGRMFTGDRSADWLLTALHRQGWCNQPSSRSRDDGLALTDAYISSVVHCVPPANKPVAQEIANCRPYLAAEMGLLRNLEVVVALGKVAFDGFLVTWGAMGRCIPSPRPKFGHGVVYDLEPAIKLVGSYHPSQQNTQTGKLTREMFDSMFARVRDLLGPR